MRSDKSLKLVLSTIILDVLFVPEYGILSLVTLSYLGEISVLGHFTYKAPRRAVDPFYRVSSDVN